MNTNMKPSICLRPAAIFLTLSLALAGLTARELVPFKGSLQGHENDVLNFPQLLVDGAVTGVATHVGRFTMTYKVTVTLPAGTSTGSAVLTAANGDTILTTIVGVGVLLPDGLNSITEINTITGGTGRFAGAKGSFTVDRLEDPATGVTSGTIINGLITSPGVE
jgi:hypothetical protein